MSNNSNKNKDNPDFYSLEEPAVAYNVTPKTEVEDSETHPILIKLLEKAMQESREGKGSTTEEVMKRVREKYPFLNGI